MTKNAYYKKMFKVVTAATVTAGAVVAVAPTADAATSKFPDVTDKNVHAENIQKIADRGIVQGYPDGTFKPYASVTRGQAAKIIAGVLGLETDPAKVKNPGFTDLQTTNEYYGAVAALVEVGAINGFTDNTYKTYQPITRVQMAKIIAEAFKLQAAGVENPFTDAKSNTIGDNVKYVNALYATKVTTGTSATTFSPRANVTRGQIASFVIRAEEAAKATTTPGIIGGWAPPAVDVADVVLDGAITELLSVYKSAATDTGYITDIKFTASSNTIDVTLTTDITKLTTPIATVATELRSKVADITNATTKAAVKDLIKANAGIAALTTQQKNDAKIIIGDASYEVSTLSTSYKGKVLDFVESVPNEDLDRDAIRAKADEIQEHIIKVFKDLKELNSAVSTVTIKVAGKTYYVNIN